MSTQQWQRSTKKAKKPANLYKILGTRSNISQKRIREKYVEQLRQHPPETHPEEFRQIREAYETLRDPEKRRQYDAQRNMKHSPEELLDQVLLHLDNANFEEARAAAEKVLTLGESPMARIALLTIAYRERNAEEMQRQLDVAQHLDLTTHEAELIGDLQILQRFAAENWEQATAELRRLCSNDASARKRLEAPTFETARMLGNSQQENQAWELYLALLPTPGANSTSDITIIDGIIVLMSELERWDRKSEVMKLCRAYAKALKNPDDVEDAVDFFADRYQELWDGGAFREAQVCLDLLLELDRKNPQHRQWQRELKQVMSAFKELQKERRDQEIFPGFQLMVEIWFGTRFAPHVPLPEEVHERMRWENQMEHYGFETEEDIKFALVVSANKVRKKYPTLYKAIKEDIDAALVEFNEGLSRRERRMARKPMPDDSMLDFPWKF